MANSFLTIENLSAASDADLKAFVKQKSNSSTVLSEALQIRRANLETDASNSVELLKQLLDVDPDEDEYNLDNLLEDMRNNEVSTEYKTIADFLRGKNLTTKVGGMSRASLVIKFTQYQREQLEEQAKRILQQEQSSAKTTNNAKLRNETVILAVLREIEERVKGQRDRLVGQTGSITSKVDTLTSSVASMLSEISKAATNVKTMQEHEPQPVRTINPLLAQGITGLKGTKLKKSVGPTTTSENSASTANESATDKSRRNLEAVLGKKQVKALPKSEKTRLQIQQDKIYIINVMQAEIDFLNSGEIPVAIQDQLEELERISRRLEQYQLEVREKQAQLMQSAATTKSHEEAQTVAPRKMVNPGLLAGIAAAGAKPRENKEPTTNAAPEQKSELTTKEQVGMALVEATEKRRLQAEYISDAGFRTIVDAYLEKMQKPFIDSLENRITKTHILGLFKKHNADIERRDRIARSKMELDARKRADELTRQKSEEQLNFLEREGIHLIKTNHEGLLNSVSDKLAQAIARSNEEIKKLPGIISSLDKAIAAKKDSINSAEEKEEVQPPLIRKKLMVVTEQAAEHVPVKKIEKLKETTINEYMDLLKELYAYASEVRNINAGIKPKNKSEEKILYENGEVLGGVCNSIETVQRNGFRGDHVTAINVKDFVNMTATTMELANKVENYKPEKSSKLSGMLGMILMGILKLVEKVGRLLGILKDPPVTKNIFAEIEHMKQFVFRKAQNIRPSDEG